ncbi:MAG: cell division protein ZapA [Rhodospirillales bacterium]|jgi:cell division protein ZapA|nr:cell division protein ZapA [Rhodospirillales bacterium]
MGQVAVTVNGRRFDITCDDGQEQHVQALAADIDHRVATLVESLGALGDTRLLLLAALLIADDLEQARSEVDAWRQRIDQDGRLAPGAATLFDTPIDATLTELALRIEAVAARLRDA